MSIDNIKWDGTVAEGFKNLQPGTYRGGIFEYEVKEGTNGKSDMLIAHIEVMAPEQYKGIRTNKVWFLTDKTIQFVARDLADLECPINNQSPLSVQINKLPIIGKTVDFKFEIPKDKDKPNVTWIHLSEHSAVCPKGARDGIKAGMAVKNKPKMPPVKNIQSNIPSDPNIAEEVEEDIPF